MSLAAFIATSLLLTLGAISPGPAVLMAARTGVTEGMRTGFFLALGIGAGAVIWSAAALSGLTIVFQVAPSLLLALKLAGGAYLLWLGWHLWRHADTPVAVPALAVPRTAASAFRLGVLTQLANPKPVVVLSAIFLGTVPPGTPLAVKLALLAVVFTAESGWNVIVARIFSLDRTRAGYLRLKGVIDRAFGGMLALLGLKIAAT